MQTDLSLNGHRLRGSIHRINGFLNTKNGNKFLLNGCDEIIMNQDDEILNIKVMYINDKSQYTSISFKMKFLLPPLPPFRAYGVNNYSSTETTKTQTININHIFKSCCSMFIELTSVAKDEKLLMLLEYLIP